MIARETIEAMVAEAALAPSAHNVQPARWRIEADGVTLFEDRRRRLTVGDPSGRDAAIGLGAAAEGFRLAANRAGFAAAGEAVNGEQAGDLIPVRRLRLSPGAAPDPLADYVQRRQSWRGAFAAAGDADRRAAQRLVSDDLAVLADAAVLGRAGEMLDAAAWRFMVRDDFRHELVSWMRLKRGDPNWSRDGMNADALAMSGVEAFGAALVLGPCFKALKAVGLARPLTAEGGKAARATALVLLHRPRGESPFDNGAAFYRAWLRIEAAGFAASVLSSLADDPQAAQWAGAAAGLAPDRRLVSAFRIGRRTGAAEAPRARLPLGELIVGAA